MRVILDGARDALKVGALSLGVILFIVLILQSHRARAHVYCAYRSLYAGGVRPGLEEEIKTTRDAIAELENLERRVAADYGMAEDIDSDEVFQKVKSEAFAKTGADDSEDLRKLGTLHLLRLELSQLVSENIIAGHRTGSTYTV